MTPIMESSSPAPAENTAPVPTGSKAPAWRRLLKTLLFAVAGIVVGAWLFYTPGGLLGKADAVGYAVCHRITVRSFMLGERQLPLCSRCSGMYMGALLGFVLQWQASHRGGMPARKFQVLFGLFLLVFAFDGINSYLQLWHGIQPLYVTHNWMRMVTGSGMGLAMAGVLVPVFNQSTWAKWQNQPVLQSWRQMAVMLAAAILMDAAILSQNVLILYPVGLLSAATVLAILSTIYAIVWIMLWKKDNSFTHVNQVSAFLLGGFATAVAQVAIMDLGRYILTGTWTGIIP